MFTNYFLVLIGVLAILLNNFSCIYSKLIQLKIPLNCSSQYFEIIRKYSQSIDEISAPIVTQENLNEGILHAEWFINTNSRKITNELFISHIQYSSLQQQTQQKHLNIKKKKHKRHLETYYDFDFYNFKLNSSRHVHTESILKHYFSVQQVYAWLGSLQNGNYSKDFLHVINIGETVQKRDMKVLKIGLPKNTTHIKALWFDAGIHAREWTTINTIVYLIDQLLHEYNNHNQTVIKLFSNFDFYFLPIFNPDGYNYSLYDEEFWRKNMREHKNNSRSHCFGVDLNRNFDYRWSETRPVQQKCAEDTPGTHPHSEPEVKAVVDFMTKATQAQKIKWWSYVSIHSFGGYWLTDWNKFDTERHASRVSMDHFTKSCLRPLLSLKKLKRLHNFEYKFGIPLELINYTAYGTSDVYFKMKHNITYSYTMEIGPTENEIINTQKTHGFHVHEKEISSVVLKSYTVLYEYVSLFVEKIRKYMRTQTVEECNSLYYKIHEFYHKQNEKKH